MLNKSPNRIFILRIIAPIFFLFGSLLSYSQTTLVVNSTLDDASPGTLRTLLNQANINSNAGNPHEIVFTGLTQGDQINIDDVLQVTGDYITINGDINGDFAPDIVINANNTGISGIEVSGSNNFIYHLNIIGFQTPSESAIVIQGSDNAVLGNYLGTDLSGLLGGANPNSRGISLEAGSGHLVGDGTPEGRNVIGRNTIGIFGQGISSSFILGNFVGVGVDGATALANSGAGIELVNTTQVRIGGANPGEENVISGNGGVGIILSGNDQVTLERNHIGVDESGGSAVPNNGQGVTSGSANSNSTFVGNLVSGNLGTGIELNNSTNDTFFGNLIGLDISGTTAIPNLSHGIHVGASSGDAAIGDGSAANRNYISGNTGNGILIDAGPNVIYGNYIGTDITGNNALGNGSAGVMITGGPGTWVGEANLGNVISGNNVGVAISDGTFHRVFGNLIGTNAAGDAFLGNNTDGVILSGTTVSATVGHSAAGRGNVISGNGGSGVLLDGGGVNSNQIRDNYIGLLADGVSFLGNSDNGITVQNGASTNNIFFNSIADNAIGVQINGSATNFTNVFENSIYQNTGKGIEILGGAQGGILPPVITSAQSDGTITGTASPSSRVDLFLDSEDEGQHFLGFVNSDAAGDWNYTISLSDIPNGLPRLTAVQVPNGISSEFSPASELGQAYIVINTNDAGPGSLRWVLENTNGNSDLNNVTFNIPNTDPNYTAATGNEYWTIYPASDLPRVTSPINIDGATQPAVGAYPIRLDGQGLVGNGLYFETGGNAIFSLYMTGFDSGQADDAAILIFHSSPGGSVIGRPGRGNVLNGSKNGLRVMLADNMTIQGNLVGTDETGTIAMPNEQGIAIATSSTDNVIGGLAAVEGNLISGNTNEGLFINAGGNQIVVNNLIGTDISGLNSLPNNIGMHYATSPNININNNTISGNTTHGIRLLNAVNGRIYANRIGVGSDGTTPLGNGEDGIRSFGSPIVENNTIGGTLLADANIIAHNTGAGIRIADDNHQENQILINMIYCNGERGIELGLDGPVGQHGNDGVTPPIILGRSGSFVDGAGSNDGDIIHVYRDNSGCSPAQGPEYLGTASVMSGVWDLSGISISASDVITATLTDGSGNTSAFTEPEINLFEELTAVEIFDGQATVVDIGTAYFGDEILYSLEVVNDGTMPLAIFSETSTNSEIVIMEAPAEVNAQDSDYFDLRIDGNTAGVFTGDIIITSDDYTEPTFSFPIQGEIIDAARIRVFEGPDISGTQIDNNPPGVIQFGSAPEGNDITREFTIENYGSLDLNITDITSDISEFITSGVPSVVAAGSSETFEIILYEANIGNHVATITIQSSDPVDATFNFDVEGSIDPMYLPDMYVGYDDGQTQVQVTDQVIDLGTTPLGVDLVGNFFLDNNGDADLNVSSMLSSDLEFTVQNAPSIVAMLAREPFEVVLDASNIGVFSTFITIESDDPNRPIFPFMVRGEVVDQGLTIKEGDQNGSIIDENTPIDVGTTPPSSSIDKVFVIENPGSGDLIINSIQVDDPAFTLENVPSSISPGSFASFTVVFSTSTLGPHQGTVVIDTNVGTFTFFVTGVIVEVQVYNAVSPNNDGVHDFLKIENVEFFDSNTVVIYTRWGDKIFEMDGYDNVTKVFDGTANTGGAGELPDGTYYYVLNYSYSDSSGNEISNTLTGFFLIRR